VTYIANPDLFIETFLSSLEERQRDSRLYIDTIGDILQAHAPNFYIYSVQFRHTIIFFHELTCVFFQDYCVGQGPATKLLQSLRTAKPDLDAQLTVRDDAHVGSYWRTH
jgi:actin cytoskeleton-regulatory complex protein PAN1